MVLVAAVVSAGLVVASAAGPPSAAAACTNEAVRAEQGTASSLPDCRAYELVSPGSVPLVGSTGLVSFGVRAASDGNRISYFSYYPYPGASSSGFFFRATRGDAAWEVEAMTPQVLPGAAPVIACEAEIDYSDDLASSVLRMGREIKQESPEDSFCGHSQEELVPGEPVGFANLLLRQGSGAPFELVNAPPEGVGPANGQFQGGSRDLSHVVFGEEAPLTPEAPPGYDLYEWFDGAIHLVSFLPDGSPVRGDLAGAVQHMKAREGRPPIAEGGTPSGAAPFINSVSADGERVFFYADGDLFLRENAGRDPTGGGSCTALEADRACTLQIDLSRGLGKSGGGVFQFASTDGTRVFFTDENQLTFPSSAEPKKPDLYEYDVETEELKDLTIGEGEAANVRGFSGASEDGSYLYFVARGILTGGGENSEGAAAAPNSANLYLAHEGTLTFIATLDRSSGESDLADWQEALGAAGEEPATNTGVLTTRTSPDGHFFAFNSVRNLTGAGGPRQIFLFDATSGELSCASCLPGGVAPPGPSAIPNPISAGEGESPGYLPRGLTDRGQLFFTTSQALVAGDTDGTADVYEYLGGVDRLLSDGAGVGPSYFMDASAGGGDVFFATSDPLVAADTDNQLSLYDANVDGGFAEPGGPPASCVGDACRGAASSAPAGTGAATSSFAGPGNPKPKHLRPRCRKNQVRRHGRCVKRSKRHRHRNARHQARRRGQGRHGRGPR